MTDDTTNPSGRRRSSRRRRRAASRLRRVGFAAGGVAVLLAAGLLLGGLTGADLPGISLVMSDDDSSSTTTTTSVAVPGADGSAPGGGDSATGTGGSSSSKSSSKDGKAGTAGHGGNKSGVPSPSNPADPSQPGGPSSPTDPGAGGPTSPTSPTTPGDPTAPRALPDADKLAGAALTAADLGGGWKQLTTGIQGINFACDATRMLVGDTSAARALRRPGVTITTHAFGFNGTTAADTFAAYRAAAAGCHNWKITEYARSLDIALAITSDSPNHLVVSYVIQDRGHPTIYQTEHVLLSGNTIGIVHAETTATPTKDLLTTLAGGADTVASRLAALAV